MSDLRVLTVRQPWAWAIFHGKDVENRTRNLAGKYRGPVAIQAGKTFDEDARERESWPELKHALAAAPAPHVAMELGVIIGVVDLVDVHEGHNTETDQFRAVRSCFRPGKPYGPCSRWAEADAWHLVLANPRPLTAPIPFKGALHLQKATADLVAAIESQIGARA